MNTGKSEFPSVYIKGYRKVYFLVINSKTVLKKKIKLIQFCLKFKEIGARHWPVPILVVVHVVHIKKSFIKIIFYIITIISI